MASPGVRLMIALLATTAFWALLVLIATWSGLGGRYSLHPDDPDRVEPVPEVELAGSTSLIPDMDHYAGISQHPLFSKDRLPFVGDDAGEDNIEVVEEEVLMPLDATLTGVIKIGEDTAIALIRGNKTGESQSVKVGDNLPGDLSSYKLIELESRKAVFDGPRGRSELELETFNGKGGKPATALQEPRTGEQAGDDGREPDARQADEDNSPEAQAERIRRRIEERRRQMREEAERARAEQDG